MEISEIISISGQGGLFKVIARTKTGLIVESLKDKKRMPVYASQKISALEDISIFGKTEDLPLKEIFQKIYERENGGKALEGSSDNATLKSYFSEVFPDFDEERVYTSDMKKVFVWYNTLLDMGLLKSEEKKEEKAKAKAENEDGGTEDKPKKAKTVKASTKVAAKAQNTAAPKASSKSKGAKTGTVRKTGV